MIQEKKPGLPNITGVANSIMVWNTKSTSGAFTLSTNANTRGPGGGSDMGAVQMQFDASRSNAIYGKSTTVQPASITLIPQIRFSRDDADVGDIKTFIGTRIPQGYLSCDGQVYQIENYQSLADFILDQFGQYDFFGGDGTLTFAVPNLNSSSSPVLQCIKY